MSTRIDVIIDHRVDNYRNSEAAAMLLADTVPAAMAVREYWRTADPESSGPEPEFWKRAQHHTAEHPVYLGPVVSCSALASRWSLSAL